MLLTQPLPTTPQGLLPTNTTLCISKLVPDGKLPRVLNNNEALRMASASRACRFTCATDTTTVPIRRYETV
ncbi:hypothetical protein NSPZN2_10250 [Nitrospira defluvii]|uniref:Uncharacterized protein n=1 Tax=Nitrospira defluvii TaxID=330214 RepID=A0ABM8QDM6_9BACT|nr:hypothetical protein NSPZN2_10250 [Nitrospira defluvii]